MKEWDERRSVSGSPLRHQSHHLIHHQKGHYRHRRYRMEQELHTRGWLDGHNDQCSILSSRHCRPSPHGIRTLVRPGIMSSTAESYPWPPAYNRLYSWLAPRPFLVGSRISRMLGQTGKPRIKHSYTHSAVHAVCGYVLTYSPPCLMQRTHHSIGLLHLCYIAYITIVTSSAYLLYITLRHLFPRYPPVFRIYFCTLASHSLAASHGPIPDCDYDF